MLLYGFSGQPMPIKHQRGLCQGDPLSPMLFILVMDVLGVLFTKAEEVGLLQQLSVKKKLNRISMYADDVALFLHPMIQLQLIFLSPWISYISLETLPSFIIM